MERFLLYLDDIDDAVFALAFVRERRGGPLRTLLAALFMAMIGIATVYVALHDPALGAASLALLTVLLLYRSATLPPPVKARGAR
jgi:hypothetical protein